MQGKKDQGTAEKMKAVRRWDWVAWGLQETENRGGQEWAKGYLLSVLFHLKKNPKPEQQQKRLLVGLAVSAGSRDQ